MGRSIAAHHEIFRGIVRSDRGDDLAFRLDRVRDVAGTMLDLGEQPPRVDPPARRDAGAFELRERLFDVRSRLAVATEVGERDRDVVVQIADLVAGAPDAARDVERALW